MWEEEEELFLQAGACPGNAHCTQSEPGTLRSQAGALRTPTREASGGRQETLPSRGGPHGSGRGLQLRPPPTGRGCRLLRVRIARPPAVTAGLRDARQRGTGRERRGGRRCGDR
ncbi:hypothetical protein P7K49_026661 [Saguinus oedipus]|uniref:Uncharacterized protein n=1 Tax=Saguinus oedipus TaxID=9490 RepID=A0ABQ9UEP1_SAGOE|nr:hypothetical protein P7K49_026661 [Saguinus oedipus]